MKPASWLPSRQSVDADHVLCPDALPVRFADFGFGTGLILLSEVQCSGDEEMLTDCRQDDIAQNFLPSRPRLWGHMLW